MDFLIALVIAIILGYFVLKLNLNNTLVARFVSIIAALVGSMLINFLFLANFFNNTGIGKKDTFLNQVLFYGILVLILYAFYIVANISYTKLVKMFKGK